MVGEKLIANKPIIEFRKLGKTILFNTNDEFEIVSYQIKKDQKGHMYYEATAEEILLSGEKNQVVINILHEDSEIEFNRKAASIKLNAMREPDVTKKKSEWRYYYDYLSTYADINYNYAITCHKAQGSSYSNTFILEDDICQNNKVIERNRILYTAVTRAIDKCFLVKRTHAC